jgi:hypothetical protein
MMVGSIASTPQAAPPAALRAPGSVLPADAGNATAAGAGGPQGQQEPKATQTKNAVPPAPPSDSGRGQQLDIQV